MAIEKLADFIVGDTVVVQYQSDRDYCGAPRNAIITGYKWCRHTMNGKKVDNCFYKVTLDDGTETSVFNGYIKHKEHPMIYIVVKGKMKKVNVYSSTLKVYDAITKYVDSRSSVVTVSRNDIVSVIGLAGFQVDRALDELVKLKVLARVLLGRSITYFASPGIYCPNDNATIISMFS